MEVITYKGEPCLKLDVVTVEDIYKLALLSLHIDDLTKLNEKFNDLLATNPGLFDVEHD